jgi:hypothetical protein
MPLYSLTSESITPLPPTNFSAEQIYERDDLQRLLRDQIEVLFPDEAMLVLAEEFGDWDDSRRRVDLLCLDSDANLVVVELKRTESGGHMELQALRYAAMVSTMTFEQAAQAHAQYLQQRDLAEEDVEHQARQAILQFLGWDESQEDGFADNVRIVLASQNFHRELTTTVMWLLEREIDIRCLRLIPYKLANGEIVLNVDQVIPLPEAAEYQIRVSQKRQRERAERKRQGHIKIDLTLGDQSWDRLTKRAAMLHMVQFLVASGINPIQIADAIPWRKREGFLMNKEGLLDANEFCSAAEGTVEGTRMRFHPKKWFCEEDQLIHHEGQTWSLRKYWGKFTPKALGNLIQLAKDAAIPEADSMEFRIHE